MSEPRGVNVSKERVRLALLIADRLAEVYNTSTAHAARVAEACDESWDRSGNLLGWLREYARLVR